MSWRGCSRLDEVRQALTLGHWPEACQADLRAHVEGCSRCSEVVLLTNHFQVSRTEAINASQTEPPNLLWWRAQLRRRNTACSSRAGRPLMAAQVFALLITVVAIAGATAIHWHSLWDRVQAARWTPLSSLCGHPGGLGPRPPDHWIDRSRNARWPGGLSGSRTPIAAPSHSAQTLDTPATLKPHRNL